MSRICVKNIPKYVKEDRLRDFFSQKGEVTDAKIMRTKDGRSRQFAFVGFRTEQEAQEALDYLNNSYMDTCRITCEVARKIGDPDIPRPWSRYSAKKDIILKGEIEDNVANAKVKDQKSSNADRRSAAGSKEDDPQLQEFLKVMQPRKTKIWADDALDAHQPKGQENRITEPAISAGLKQVKAFQTQAIKVRDKKKEVKEKSVNFESGESPQVSSEHEVVKDDFISDADYFKSRAKENWMDSDSDYEGAVSEETTHDQSGKKEMDENDGDEDTDSEEDDTIANEQPNETAEADSSIHSDDEAIDNMNPTSSLTDEKKQVLDSGRLFVRNLPFTANEEELVELFSKFGDVSQVHLVVDKETKRSKGIGYVLYALPDSAVRALEELDNSIFQGRLLHIMPAKPLNPSLDNAQSAKGVQDKKTFKQQREEQKKASEVGGDTRSWNSLFMRADTVVENIARRHGLSKSHFLDREADDLAVRIALGETQVISETKKALLGSGINITALEDSAAKKSDGIKRSNRVILVKNLPYSCCEADLVDMFGKYGSLEKVVLPPTKVMALVIFLEAAEARVAFRGLAYKRYKDAPLYLEWAPSDILSPVASSETIGEKKSTAEGQIKNVLFEHYADGALLDELDPDRVESRSVFVKNLNFKTTDESLKKHFSDNIKSGSIKSVKVKKHIKNGKSLSMGFGFVEFDSVETATNVCRDLQGTVLDGHALILQLCHSKSDSQAVKKEEKDKSSTKLIVRNVAFEATEKDLRQLFSPFGQIKSLRLPMKLGSHRGFAFVEYVTKQEAQSALKSLSNTHLYGRHLVLEQAKEGETLEDLRARTAAHFVDEHTGYQKLSKRRKLAPILDESKI